jgi:hypothetical protein
MQSLDSRISTVYMYQLDLPSGRILLSSSSAGSHSEQEGAPWWPLGVGPESENVGNVLVLESFPASALVGVRLVTYGRVSDSLSIWLAADNTPEELLRMNQNVRFTPLLSTTTLGFASLRVSRTVTFNNAGLYWLSSTFPNSPVRQLPLFVENRSAWPALS